MGCDIHLYIERQHRSPLGDLIPNVWECIPPPARDRNRWPLRKGEKPNEFGAGRWGPNECMRGSYCYDCYDDRKSQNKLGCVACMFTGRDLQWFGNRNYEIFGILAGVRDPDFVPISEPRGMPVDISEVLRDHHSWDHTPTWLRLDEILMFNWDQTREFSTHLPVFADRRDKSLRGDPSDSFEEWYWRDDGARKEPRRWYYTSSGDVRVVSTEQALELCKSLGRTPKEKHRNTYTRISWTKTYRTCAKDFLDFIDEVLIPATLGDTEYPVLKMVHHDALLEGATNAETENIWLEMMCIAERVRLVFGFDS